MDIVGHPLWDAIVASGILACCHSAGPKAWVFRRAYMVLHDVTFSPLQVLFVLFQLFILFASVNLDLQHEALFPCSFCASVPSSWNPAFTWLCSLLLQVSSEMSASQRSHMGTVSKEILSCLPPPSMAGFLFPLILPCCSSVAYLAISLIYSLSCLTRWFPWG